MPTSSQSKILSVIDYQLVQKQPNGQDEVSKLNVHSSANKNSLNETKRRHSKDERRASIENKNGESNRATSPFNSNARRLSSSKNNDGKNSNFVPATIRNIRKCQRHFRCMHHDHSYPSFRKGLQSARVTQRAADILHVPVINLNNMAQNQSRIPSSSVNGNDNRQNRTVHTNDGTKSTLVDGTMKLSQYYRNSIDSEDDTQIENNNQSKQIKKYPTPVSADENTTSESDVDQGDDDNDDNNNDDSKHERRSSLLNENARRLLILGTIRPSKTFYKNLSDADADHLMEYFRKMKTSHQRLTSEEIHQELSTKFVEYKPKIFFDSASVTKHQVTDIEKIVEQYADKIRTQKAEFARLDNPMRFVIRQLDNDKPLTIIPREYNDCFITLVTRSDPLRKSDLVTGLVQENLLEDVKANSLDISYFPGGVNYDVPRDEIDENGQMNLETYQKLKKRLNSRKVWYFDGPPEKKTNAFLATVPPDTTITIDHQRLLDALYDRLRSSSTNANCTIEQQILSIEFSPLSCIFNSSDMSNQFIVDCDTMETKQKLLEKPLKIVSNKHSVNLELQSYDENIQREYEKFIKSEKYRELIKNHDSAVKRTSKTK
ncbi:unnamed protein product [Rotaria magnacalcarata]|uniref:Uncharacterized protein n=3 Tax=Rotaria magnacalcarata TaxID=392030 RepID=A0A816B0A7_9BILA|nr:unnamed protein product [Rotaria magnacalcarata]